MTTKGNFIFKHKGKYYVFYNRNDAYPWGPYGLGFRLIENLKKLTKEELIHLLEHMLLILEVEDKDDVVDADSDSDYDFDSDSDFDSNSDFDSDIYSRRSGREVDFISIEYALSNPYLHEYCIKKHEPCFIKNGKMNSFYCMSSDYLYIINLDQELFIIKAREEPRDVEVQFFLFDIPNDWFQFYERVLESTYDETDETDEDYKPL